MNNNATKEKIKKVLSKFMFPVKIFVIFFFLFEINCSAFGMSSLITTRRIAIIIMIVHAAIATGKLYIDRSAINKSFVNMFLLQLFMLIYSGILWALIGRGSGEHIFDCIVRYLFVAFLGAYALSCYFESLDEMLHVFLAATLIQSAIIVFFAFSPGIQESVNKFIGQDADALSLHDRGYLTGLACAASSGALRMIPGFAACIYFITKKKRSSLYIVFYCVLAFCATIIARTSLFIAAAGLLFILAGNISQNSKKGVMVTAGFFIVFSVAFFVKYFFNMSKMLETLFARLIYLFNHGAYDSFFASYFGQIRGSKSVLPELSAKTMVGTGVVSGMSGNGVFVNFDGGYARVYVALGLPLAVIMYVFTFINMLTPTLKIRDKAMKYTAFFMIAYLFIGEFKEFFLYNGLATAVFYAMIKLYFSKKRGKAK